MSVLFKQAVSIIDSRTTNVCLKVAGQIVPLAEPFSTLNGFFDMPPFHVHCRSIAVPYMTGFVNEQRVLANAELQLRPFKTRDTRGAKTAPPDVGNPPTSGVKAPTPKSPPPSPRSVALDVAELKKTVSDKEAAAVRAAFVKQGGVHKQFVDAIDVWNSPTGRSIESLRTGQDEAAVAFRDVIASAPLTKTVLYRGMTAYDPVQIEAIRALKVGDAWHNNVASSFSDRRGHAAEFLGGSTARKFDQLDDAAYEAAIAAGLEPLNWSGVYLEFEGIKRALPINGLSWTDEGEWLYSNDLEIVLIEEVGFEAWRIVVREK